MAGWSQSDTVLLGERRAVQDDGRTVRVYADDGGTVDVQLLLNLHDRPAQHDRRLLKDGRGRHRRQPVTRRPAQRRKARRPWHR